MAKLSFSTATLISSLRQNQWHLLHRLGFGFVEEVGVYFCRGNVGVAHQLLHRVYGHILRQQQHAEGVAGAVEGDGFLYPGLFAPPLQHHVDFLAGLFLEDILATMFLPTQQSFRFGT